MTAETGYAIGHNVVVVDGDKETQYRWSHLYQGTTIDGFVQAPNLSWARADLRYAYNFESPHAAREHFFSRVPDRPVIVATNDSLQRDADGAHTYTWQMLTRTGNVVVPDGGSGFRIDAPSGASLVGRAAVDGSPLADPSVQTRYQVFDNVGSDDAPGAPVAFTTTPPQQKFDQLTVLAITPPGVVAGDVATDAVFAKFTRDGGETLLREGTRLVGYGREYVVVTRGPTTVTVSGGEISATGPPGARYRVYSPGTVERVTVNGSPVPWCRVSNEVLFPCRHR